MSYLRYVKVIGTMHVSPRSREKVYRTIIGERPHAVAIELDRLRFLSMMEGRNVTLGDSLHYGRAGLINYLLAKVEERLGEEFGMAPGEEMKVAVSAAREVGAQLHLVDEDIRVILSKLSSAPFREKLLMGAEAIGVFLPLGNVVEGDPLEEYRAMMHQFRVRYPYLYRVLVEERNEVMARNIISVVNMLKSAGIKRPRVIAVVGLGHKSGIEHILDRAGELDVSMYYGSRYVYI